MAFCRRGLIKYLKLINHQASCSSCLKQESSSRRILYSYGYFYKRYRMKRVIYANVECSNGFFASLMGKHSTSVFTWGIYHNTNTVFSSLVEHSSRSLDSAQSDSGTRADQRHFSKGSHLSFPEMTFCCLSTLFLLPPSLACH